MGVPTSEVGYTPAMPRREDHEVHKGHVVALDKKKIREITRYQNLMEIRPVGAELFHAVGRTDTQTDITVAFRNFANAPTKGKVFLYTS